MMDYVDKTYEKPIYNRKMYFEDQDLIREQVHKIWVKFDINRSGALDKVETANFLKDFCAANGKQAPSMQTFTRFFLEFDKNRDGLISKQEMARFIKSFNESNVG